MGIFCGMQIHRFLYIDVVVTWIILPVAIVQYVLHYKIEFDRIGIIQPILMAITFILFAIVLSLFHLLFYRGITERNVERCQLYLKIKIPLEIICYAHRIVSIAFKNQDESFPVSGKVMNWVAHMPFCLLTLAHVLAVFRFIKELKAKALNEGCKVLEREDFIESLEDQDQKFIKSIEIPGRLLNIDFERSLGKGQTGTVVKGLYHRNRFRLKSPTQIALKIIANSGTCADPNFTSSVISELKTLAKVKDHYQLVTFFGVTFVKGPQGAFGSVGIVLEYCDSGCLSSFLKQIRETSSSTIEKSFNCPEMLRLSMQIARGMEYLAAKGIIHGDLAARNVLLTHDKVIKITDFGMSIRLYNYQLYAKSNQKLFPWRTMAPESLTDLKFSTKSDVWSYGVLLWEIFTVGKTPYPDLAWDSNFAQEIQKGLRLERPELADKDLYDLMLRCWYFHPTLRPDFSTLSTALENMIKIKNHDISIDF